MIVTKEREAYNRIDKGRTHGSGKTGRSGEYHDRFSLPAMNLSFCDVRKHGRELECELFRIKRMTFESCPGGVTKKIESGIEMR